MTLYPVLQMTHRGTETQRFFDKTGRFFSLFDLFNMQNGIVIIARFSIAKFSIIEFLLKSSYREKDGTRDKDGTFEIRKDYIKIYHSAKNFVCLISYENKFLQEFKGFKIADELEQYDSNFKNTCAQDGKADFLKNCMPKAENWFAQNTIFSQIFPQPDAEEYAYWKQAKESVIAFYYLKAPDEYDDIFSYDFKSSFPARVYETVFPQGKGEFFQGNAEIPAKKWYIKKIFVYAIRAKIYDFFGFEKAFKKRKNGQKYAVFFITKDIEEMLQEVYEIKYTTAGGYFYKLQRTIFNEFIERNIFAQENEKKHIKKYNKGKVNSFLGTFGRNDDIKITKYFMRRKKRIYKNYKVKKSEKFDFSEKCFDFYGIFPKYKDALQFETITETAENKAFYPMYLYINGRAKCAIIRAILPIFDSVIYANTDGFFTDKYFDFYPINAKFKNEIGTLQTRALYHRMAIKDISNYCGEIIDEDGVVEYDARISGRQHGFVTYDEFINGFDTSAELLTEYGFLQTYVYHEPPLYIFKDIFDYQKRLEELTAQRLLTITQHDEVIEFEEMEKNEKTRQLYIDIMDDIEAQVSGLLNQQKRYKENDNLKRRGVVTTIKGNIRDCREDIILLKKFIKGEI